MDKIGKGLEYDAKSDDWVDFSLKIEYLLEELFDKDKNTLIEYFSDKKSLKNRNSRKKTIANWLDGSSRKPNGFDVSKFKIGELRLNDKPLFTNQNFRLWTIDRFKIRVESYMNNKETQSHIQYVYFFDTHSNVRKVSCFDVSFPKHNDNENIQLEYENIVYRGTIDTFNNITYIYVRNECDYMHFIFKISANTSKHIRIFGVAQSVDDTTGRPKSFMALLTSYILTKEEEARYAHKLNYSNTLFADDFSNECVLKEDFFLENFAQKLETLGQDLNHQGIDKNFSNEIYFNTVLKEYQSYIKLLEKARKHTKYFIGSKKESRLLSLKGICKEEKISATISYFLTLENLFLLDDKNPIIENQIKLIAEGKLDLTYLFVVPDTQLLNNKAISKIEYMEEQGIEVKITDKSAIGYSRLMLIEEHQFALFKVKDLVGDPTHVTRHQKTIEKLYLEQEILRRESYSLKAFMKEHNPISGRWYFYAYGSALENTECHEIPLDIKNNRVRGEYSSGVQNGVVFKTKKQILLIFDNSTIKIALQNINGTLFRVSTIGQDIHINHADLLVFGLLSKEPLEKSDALYLLEGIHMKEEADYRLKVSDSFARRLAEFKASMNREPKD